MGNKTASELAFDEENPDGEISPPGGRGSRRASAAAEPPRAFHPWEGEAPAEPVLLRLSRSFALPMLTTKSSPRPPRGRGVGGEGADGIPAIENRCEKVDRRNDRTKHRSAGEDLTRRREGKTSIAALSPLRGIASSLTHRCLSSVISVTSVVKKTPLTASTPDKTRAKARAKKRVLVGAFTPHPRPLSPSRGEGCHCPFHNTQKHKILPSPPRGERGRG